MYSLFLNKDSVVEMILFLEDDTMFQQKKVYKSMENRNFTPESLLKELEDLKKPSDSSTIGESIGKSIADYIGTKFGVNPNETPTPLARNKPVPPISASK